MITLSKKCTVLAVCLLFTLVTSNKLEAERTSFFGFSHEVTFSSSTVELVESLTEAVMKMGAGDRRVRRYFQRYDTPFAGASRRSG